MAIRLLESFDGVSTLQQFTNGAVANDAAGNKWWHGSNGTPTNWDFVAGRTGNALRKNNSTGGPLGAYVGSGISGVEHYYGFAYNPATAAGNRTICIGMDGSGSTQHWFLSVTTAGALVGTTVPTTSGVTVWTTASGLISFGSWQYIQLYFKLDGSVGRFDVKINGVLRGSHTGDTQRTTFSNTGMHFTFGSASGGDVESGTLFDDFYAVEVTGSGADSYLGDTKIHCKRPNGNGNENDWLGSDADSNDNYLLVDEQNVSDLDYVQSSADGDRDLYAFEDVTLTRPVTGVQLVSRAARLSEVDPKNLNHVARLTGGTETATALTGNSALTATMKERYNIWETKPGGGAWTQSDINDADFGYEQIDA